MGHEPPASLPGGLLRRDAPATHKGQHWAGPSGQGPGHRLRPVPTGGGARLAGPRISVSSWQPPASATHTHPHSQQPLTQRQRTERRWDPSLVHTHPFGSQVPGPPPTHPAQPHAALGGPVPAPAAHPGRLGAGRGHTGNYSGPDYSTAPRTAAQGTVSGEGWGADSAVSGVNNLMASPARPAPSAVGLGVWPAGQQTRAGPGGQTAASPHCPPSPSPGGSLR